MARHTGVTPEETRTRLVQAGVELFGERGFDGVTTRELAARAGLTLGALHHNFATKEEMYEHTSRAVDDEVTRFYQHLITVVDPTAGFAQQLEFVTRRGWRFAREHRAVVRFRFREWFEGGASTRRVTNEQMNLQGASEVLAALSGVPAFDVRVRVFAVVFAAMRFAMATERELLETSTDDGPLENALVAMTARLFAPSPG